METRRKAASKYRLAATILVFVLLLAAGKAAGLDEALNIESLRARVADAGALGVAGYFAAFAVGQLVHVPGMIFVGTGILAYGKAAGFGVSLVAAVTSVTVSFVVVRAVGGQALAEIERPFIKRMIARLDARPITTTILLRTVFWLSPGLTYALALSSIRLRDYVIGSSLGLIAPILGATLLFEWFFA